MLFRPGIWLLFSSLFSLTMACGSSGDDAGEQPDGSTEPDATIDTTPVKDAPATVDATIDCGPDAGHANELACTGLYSDWGSRTIASNVHEFKPGFELWSDGASKRRWLYLPAGTKID